MSRFENIPLAPARFPFYYGWVVVAAGTLGIVASIPGQTMGVSVFTDSLLEALGLSRNQLSAAYMFGTITSSFLLTPAGRLVDRWGVRPTVVLASVGLSLSLLALRSCDSIAEAIMSLVNGAGATIIPLGVAFTGFLCIRFFGQGLLSMIPRVMIGRWFERRRGMAFGIAGVVTALAFGRSPIVFDGLIESHGWRGAYAVMALSIGLGMSLVGLIFFREGPESSGLLVDGRPPERGGAESRPAPAVRDFTLEEARKTYTFWVYSLALSCQGLIVTGLTFHIVSIAAEAGLSREQGLAVFTPMAIFSVCSTLAGGWLSDRIPLKWMLLTMTAMLTVGAGGVLVIDHAMGRALMSVGFGISGGLFVTLVGVSWPRFFGLRHLGAISGLNMSILVFGSSIGPALLAFPFSLTGSYKPGILACAGLAITAFIAGTRATNPQTGVGH